MSDDNQEFVIRVRGLPWTCTVDQIITFFEPIEIKGGADGVHITKSREGRPNGEAFIEFESAEDMAEAEKKHNEHIGRRYIEVFPAQKSELDWVVKREFTGSDDEDDCCVKLRGLPFNCSKEEIYQFFSGLEIVPNGIAMATDFQGRTTGEAFVQFVSKKMADKAQELHKEKIGHRYIEIFPSNLEQIRAAMSGRGGGMRGGPPPFIGPQAGPFGDDDDGPPFNNMNFNNGGGPMGGGGFNNRSAPYDARDRMGGPNRFNRGFNDFDGGNMGGWGGRGRGGARNSRPRYPTNSVHMRGLPFKASDYDIIEFFKPLSTVNITLGTDNNGRASGEADVEFGSHEDAVKAMEKHKCNMKHRYIELFLNSSPKEEEFPRGRGGFDMGGDGDMNNMGGDMMGAGNMGGGMMGNMGGGMMGNMGGGYDNMGWNQGNMGWGSGNMGGWGGGGNMGGWGGGGNMGGMGGNMGMGGMGSGNMGMGSGGNMGGMGGNMGGMGGNMGGMGGNMGGMGGNMGGMGGNMGGMGGMGGNMGGMGSNMGSGMGNMGFGGGNGNMGSGMGMGSGGAGMGGMEKMGRNMSGGSGGAGMKAGDSFGGKIKPTGRGGSWSTDGDRKSMGYGGVAGGTRGYGAGGDGKKEIKSSVIESRGGADYSSGAGYGTGSVPGTMDFKGDGFGYGAGKGTGTGGGYNMQGSSVASGGAGPVYDYGRNNNNANNYAGARGADFSGSSGGAAQGTGYEGNYGSGGTDRGTGVGTGGGYGGASGGMWQSGATGTESASGASSGNYGSGDYQSRAGMANYSYT